jgi:hypothetical protein
LNDRKKPALRVKGQPGNLFVLELPPIIYGQVEHLDQMEADGVLSYPEDKELIALDFQNGRAVYRTLIDLKDFRGELVSWEPA